MFASSACGAPRPNGYVSPFAAGPVVIDGVMDERAWRAAPRTADYLSIGADLEEPHVWATPGTPRPFYSFQ